jgi:transcriptional regulator with XRE-family HTH domain
LLCARQIKWFLIRKFNYDRCVVFVIYLTNIDKSNFVSLNNLGKKIRVEREKQNLLLRQVAAFLEIDTALISKVERGERKLTRLHVVKLSKLLKVSEEELISLWLCDKIIDVIAEDSYAIKGMEKAINQIKEN